MEGTNSGSVKESQKEQPDTFKEDAPERTMTSINRSMSSARRRRANGPELKQEQRKRGKM